jgi:hypothetical protein
MKGIEIGQDNQGVSLSARAGACPRVSDLLRRVLAGASCRTALSCAGRLISVSLLGLPLGCFRAIAETNWES